MHILLQLATQLAIFLIFLSATKLIQTIFMIITAAKRRDRFSPTLRNQIVIWLSISYLLTVFTYLVS